MVWAGNSGIADNLFTGAQVGTGSMAAGDVRIPSGTITSYIPTNLDVATDPDGGASDFVFGMCETMHHKVSGAQLTNLTSTSTSTLAGGVLTKTYEFVVKLDFNEASNIANLNVVDNT